MSDESLHSVVEKRDGTALCVAVADVLKVEGDDVATWRQTVQFLEEALVVAKLHQAEHEKAAAMGGAPDENLLMTIIKTPCIMPKGKLEIDFGETNLTIKGKDFTVTTPYDNVDAMLKLPRDDPVKKKTAAVVSYEFVLRLENPVAHRKTTLKYIAFEVCATSAMIPDENIVFHLESLQEDPLLEDKQLHEAVEMFLDKLVTRAAMIKPGTGRQNVRYVSTHGGSFVKCYRKTTSGLLYFLPEGLCFLNPPLFLSRKEVSSIAPGRETAMHLRTFDLVVEVADAPNVEFSMVEKEEIPSITEFVNNFSLLKASDERSESTGGSGATVKTEDDSDEEDSDFVMEEDSETDEDYDELSGSAYSGSDNSDSDSDGEVAMGPDDDDEGPLGPFPDQVDMEDI
ncbi:hypothetical protein ACHHYP_00476 [Achlya hypogyna]|uniref:FACT complex subunit SSRP1 n=1 Tax=Achlya hypogyna TaxID=1202772 RepID=A0A1V9ZAW9_ACHHY|nr:hypothetical protein ACHHYP_00476 [Achlya hypogyna]